MSAPDTPAPKSPHWTDLLYVNKEKDSSQVAQSQKRKKECASDEQRIELLNFVLENPEMMTHSSTKENEAALWNELTNKLNSMHPEKTVKFWQNFWKRWLNQLETKKECSLTKLDCRLIKFLNNVNVNKDNVDRSVKTSTSRKKLSLQDIINDIEEVEKEKTQVKLDVDSIEYNIVKYKSQIKEWEKSVSNKKRLFKQLTIKKNNLNNKKRKIEENNKSDDLIKDISQEEQ